MATHEIASHSTTTVSTPMSSVEGAPRNFGTRVMLAADRNMSTSPITFSLNVDRPFGFAFFSSRYFAYSSIIHFL